MTERTLQSLTRVGSFVHLIKPALPILLGAAASLALPPHYWLALLIPAFAGLLLLLEGKHSIGGAFVVGWLFGLGYFFVGLFWLGEAFGVDPGRYAGWALPAVIGLSMGLAGFAGVAGALFYAVRADSGPLRVLSFAAAWTLAEWLRGTILSGFPWNLVGYVWTATDETLQAASVIGVYGLGFLTVVAAALPRLAFLRLPDSRLSAAGPIIGSIIIVGALYLGGAYRLQHAAAPQISGVTLRIVQANIPQGLKWRPEERERIFDQYMDLSASGSADRVTHLIWPETALPFLLGEDAERRALIVARLPGTPILLTGSVRRSVEEDGTEQYFNSLMALDPDGQLIGVYDKMKLVPFGEYMPLRNLHGMKKLTAGSVDFTPGRNASRMSIPGAPSFDPVICYEAIFPNDSVLSGGDSDWLLNITNDGWFGGSDGPYQHFQMARVRAVERGVPLVRAANTGVSAVVDPFGRIREQLPLGVTGVIDAALPARIAGGTLYSFTGPAPVLALSVSILLASGKSAGTFRRSRLGLRSSAPHRPDQLRITKT